MHSIAVTRLRRQRRTQTAPRITIGYSKALRRSALRQITNAFSVSRPPAAETIKSNTRPRARRIAPARNKDILKFQPRNAYEDLREVWDADGRNCRLAGLARSRRRQRYQGL